MPAKPSMAVVKSRVAKAYAVIAKPMAVRGTLKSVRSKFTSRNEMASNTRPKARAPKMLPKKAATCSKVAGAVD